MASRTWTAGAPTAAATVRATTDHRGGRRRDGRDSGQLEQARTSRSATSDLSRRAAFVAVWRDLYGRSRIEKIFPDRTQT